MSELPEHLSEKSSEPFKMSAVLEAQTLVRTIAEPRAVGDSVKVSISKAARRLGFTFSRAKDIWYGDARRIDAAEIDKLRALAKQSRVVAARKSVLELRNSLACSDEGGDSELAASLDYALRQLGAEVRTVDDHQR
jgi:transposase-like protein